MSRPQVKICGLSTVEAIDAALAGGADFIGFVFEEASPRHVSLAAAAQLRSRIPERVRLVAVTSDADDTRLAAIAAAARPDVFQLHGSEDTARIAAVRERFGRPVIKAVAIARSEDFASARSAEQAADFLLFDAKGPPGAQSGGAGLAFDWRLLGGQVFARPWFLAGGLTAGNLKEAAAVSGARRFDVSSGVEVRRGEKDPGLIRAFLDTARAL